LAGVFLLLRDSRIRTITGFPLCRFEEENMNARLIADSIALRQTAERLERVGLIVDRAALSPEQRRAYFALQCLSVKHSDSAAPHRGLIGFSYPNAR
jgi:acetone carboxylase gamma subunit